MYNNNRYRNRTSIRGNNFRPRFNNKPRFASHNRGGNQRRSQLEGADINMFIKQAAPVAANEKVASGISFEDFDITQNLKVNIKNHGYNSPTPIQSQAIKPILEGHDVIGLASTGTGKTAAFLIQIINKLFKDRNQKVLVIVPTRELAAQVNQEFRNFAYGCCIYSALLIGGSNMYRQISDLRRNPQ